MIKSSEKKLQPNYSTRTLSSFPSFQAIFGRMRWARIFKLMHIWTHLLTGKSHPVPGKRIWIVEHLHIALSAYGHSHSAIAATEGFKYPGSTDEYVSVKHCWYLYLGASVWNSSVQVLLSHVWIITAVSGILHSRLPVRLPVYSETLPALISKNIYYHFMVFLSWLLCFKWRRSILA